MRAFWNTIGHALTLVAKGAAHAAVWASQHPEAVQIVGAIAVSRGANPATVNRIEAGVSQAGAAVDALERR